MKAGCPGTEICLGAKGRVVYAKNNLVIAKV